MTFWRRWIKKPPATVTSRRAWRESKRALKDALSMGNRDEIIKRTLEAAEIAEDEGDTDKMRKFSDALVRLESYERAWERYVLAVGSSQQSPICQWDGSDLAERSILVTYVPRNSIGEELRLSRFISPVAQRA